MENLEHKIYAIQYLDNGGTLHNLPKKDSLIRKAVIQELKRRCMVYIRNKMNKSESYSKYVLKIIHKNKSEIDSPESLYKYLNIYSLEKLENLKKKALHGSKKEK